MLSGKSSFLVVTNIHVASLHLQVQASIMEIGEAIKNPANRIFQTEYSGCLDISAHA